MDWVAGVFELAAKIIVGQRRWWGHLLYIISGVLWTIVAVHTGVYGLLTITIPAFGINLYNLVKWRKEEQAERWASQIRPLEGPRIDDRPFGIHRYL